MTIEFTPAGFDAFQNNITNVQTVGIGTTNPLGTLQVGSGTSTFIVTGIGSVGIGTTNPTAKFEVTGDITVSANSGSFRTIGAPNSSNTTLLLQGGAVSGSGGNIELGRDGINYYDANAQVFRNLNASTEYGRFNESGNLLVGTATSTGTASQRLQVTGGAYVSGNLGVGATNPQNPLHISGSAGTLLRLDGDSGGTGTRDIFFSEFNTTAYGGIIRYDSVADLFTFGTVDNSVVINAINVKRVTGDVGIGTTTPTDRLTLHNASGAAGMSALASGNAYLVLDGGRGGTVGNQISFIDFKLNSTIYGNLAVNEGTSGTPFEINSAVSNDVSLVGGGGNVGIASAIPTAALTIGSVGIASDGKSQIYLNGTTSNRIDFNTAGGAAPAIIGTSGTTRSAGTKIVLYPGAGGSQVDYGFGIESSALWSSSGGSFKWYGGTVGIATLSNTGNLSLSGALTIGSNSNIIADYTNATLASRTYFITNTTNGTTNVGAIPNGTATGSGFLAFNNANPTNASWCAVTIDSNTAFLRSAQTGTGAYLPLSIQTNNTTQVAISTGGEATFTKGITVSAGIVTVSGATASTSSATGALTVTGGVGVGASITAAGDVDGRRFGSNTATVTYTGTPANYATIVATGMVGLVTFTTTGIGATINVTGMIAGQKLDLFVSNPTTAKALTIQYNGTAIAGSGIATASPAQGASFALNTTRAYRFIAVTDGVPVAGDIRVIATA